MAEKIWFLNIKATLFETLLPWKKGRLNKISINRKFNECARKKIPNYVDFVRCRRTFLIKSLPGVLTTTDTLSMVWPGVGST